MSESISHVSDDEFETQVLASEKPVLVDFWAEWCGPCKAIDPSIRELAAEFGDRMQVAKVNIDQNRQTPLKYNVRGIPTLMIFKAGKVEATHIGALSKTQLKQFIDSNL